MSCSPYWLRVQLSCLSSSAQEPSQWSKKYSLASEKTWISKALSTKSRSRKKGFQPRITVLPQICASIWILTSSSFWLPMASWFTFESFYARPTFPTTLLQASCHLVAAERDFQLRLLHDRATQSLQSRGEAEPTRSIQFIGEGCNWKWSLRKQTHGPFASGFPLLNTILLMQRS